jgi:Zn-dependent peptidase ImmA (M78 family)
MATRVNIKPEMIDWAIQRARLGEGARQSHIIQRAQQWSCGKETPTLAQLGTFAKKVMVPFGYLFLDSPPEEPLPIVDFRTFADRTFHTPSPNLLDTLYGMQSRQEWMREEMIGNDMKPISFVKSINKTGTIERAAEQIRENLGLSEHWTLDCQDTDGCFSKLRQAADQLGILVFLNGIVGKNSYRTLDYNEFRGFVLADDYAPLIFINNNDTKAAKLFTLAHELAHLAFGETGVSNLHHLEAGKNDLEIHCNKIAAEFLVPSAKFISRWHKQHDPDARVEKLARYFRVSQLVIARRALDHELISREHFFRFYQESKNGWEYLKEKRKTEGSGGDHYITTRSRLSRRFSEAVFAAVQSGELLYRDAYDLLGLSGKTFEPYRKLMLENKDE